MAIIVRGAPLRPRREYIIFLQRIMMSVHIKVVLHGARHRTQKKFEGLPDWSGSIVFLIMVYNPQIIPQHYGGRPAHDTHEAESMSPFELDFQISGHIWCLAMRKNLLTAVELKGLLYRHALENVLLHFLIGIGEPRE